MVVDVSSAFAPSDDAARLPDHVSFSQLALMIRCPESYRQTRLLGMRGPASEALTLGSGVHAGIQAYYESFRTDARISKSEREQRATIAAADAVDDIVDRALNGGSGICFDDPAAIEDQAAELVQAYIRDRPAHVKPVAVEKEIRVTLPDSDIPLIGRVDLEAETSLVEIKTSASRVNTPKTDWKVQAWIYQAAIPKPVEWHVLVKNKTPLLLSSAALAVPYDETVTRKALGLASATLERIRKLYDERGPYEEWPTDGMLHPWACSMCDARAACPMGSAA